MFMSRGSTVRGCYITSGPHQRPRRCPHLSPFQPQLRTFDRRRDQSQSMQADESGIDKAAI